MNPGDHKALVVALRTKKNLVFVDAQKKQGADVEEFTHLLNSMLGMLICLREEYFRGKEVTWDEVKRCGLQPICIEQKARNAESPNLKLAKTFSGLISNLRHAFAHSNFELTGDPITGIRVWNLPPGKANSLKDRIWEAELSEQELRQVADLLVAFLEKRHGDELAENAT